MKERKPHIAALGEGEIVGGKYRVEHTLGSGGMGIVVAARHVQLGTKVAIKALLPEMLENEEAVTRFAREATSAAKISSEHVVRILDVGSLRGGAPYIVMELLEGLDCAAYLETHGPLPVELAVGVVSQACAAIADAHALGVIHRDLKPSNLFVVACSDGRLLIKVLDFGISKVDAWNAAAGADVSVTLRSIALGCPPYISPEQWRSAKDVDGHTDIWALGIILYELLAGKVPFDGNNLAQIALKVATEPPPSLRESRPDIPAGLERIVLKCLAKAPGDRFHDAAELSSALRAYDGRHATAADGSATLDGALAGSSVVPVAIASATAAVRGARHLLAGWWRDARRPKFAQAGAAAALAIALTWVGTHRQHAARAVASSPASTSPASDPPARGGPFAPLRPLISAPPAEDGVARTVESNASPPPAKERIPPTPSQAPPKTDGSARAHAFQGKATPDASRDGARHCDPPYFFDARGNRVFKVDCL